MSPRKSPVTPPRVLDTVNRLRVQVGRDILEERRRRRWTLRELGRRAGVSVSTAQAIEAGQAVSLDALTRVSVALGLEPQLMARPPGRAVLARDGDPVHAAMGEVEAEWLRRPNRQVRLDEPYQHYQFAGRGDVVVIDAVSRALLHIENRTRFPDIQQFAGSWNAKRSYLAGDLAQREQIRGGWTSVDHVIVALWSSEVLHTLRLRRRSFEALAPDAADGWSGWWNATPIPSGARAALVLFDPLPGLRRSRRRWVGFDSLDGLEPRYRGYADALAALRVAGRV
jgi:transcriptional regulator with XRE-family HTH domain